MNDIDRPQAYETDPWSFPKMQDQMVVPFAVTPDSSRTWELAGSHKMLTVLTLAAVTRE